MSKDKQKPTLPYRIPQSYTEWSNFAHALSAVLLKNRSTDIKGTKLIHDIAEAMKFESAEVMSTF